MSYYYDFKNNPQTCPKCGWVGLGTEATMGDSFAEGAEYHCPKCFEYFGYISYPLLKESLTDPRAPHADKLFAQIVEQRVEAAKNKH